MVDSRIFSRLGRSEARVHGACQQLVARMSDIYRPLNIYLALTAVVIWRNHDQEHNYTSDGLYHVDTTSLRYFGVKLSCVCLMFAYKKK